MRVSVLAFAFVLCAPATVAQETPAPDLHQAGPLASATQLLDARNTQTESALIINIQETGADDPGEIRLQISSDYVAVTRSDVTTIDCYVASWSTIRIALSQIRRCMRI